MPINVSFGVSLIYTRRSAIFPSCQSSNPIFRTSPPDALPSPATPANPSREGSGLTGALNQHAPPAPTQTIAALPASIAARIFRIDASRPMKIASETRKWPMLSSTICGSAEIRRAVS